MADKKQIVEQMMKAVDERNYGALRELYTGDLEILTPMGAARGTEALMGFMKPFLDAFPDIRHDIVGYVEQGDNVVYELRIQGTHTQPLASPQGPIPATHKRVDFRACDALTFKGGRIASYRVYFDMMGFMGQLGLVPPKG
jgi:steroid delta-isomerase-like uncharacterized protein